MPRPARKALPGSIRPSARFTSSPRPPAPTSEAITTIASAISVVWFTPAMIVGVASGIFTFSSSWNGVAPNDSAASSVSSGSCRMPRLVSRTAGGTA